MRVLLMNIFKIQGGGVDFSLTQSCGKIYWTFFINIAFVPYYCCYYDYYYYYYYCYYYYYYYYCYYYYYYYYSQTERDIQHANSARLKLLLKEVFIIISRFVSQKH